jgi:hypothetical protein
VQERLDTVGRALDPPGLAGLARAGAELRREPAVFSQAPDPGRQRSHRRIGQQHAVLAVGDDLGDATDRRCDDRRPARERLQHHVR